MPSDIVASNGSRVSHNQMNRATSIGTLGNDTNEYDRMVPLDEKEPTPRNLNARYAGYIFLPPKNSHVKCEQYDPHPPCRCD